MLNTVFVTKRRDIRKLIFCIQIFDVVFIYLYINPRINHVKPSIVKKYRSFDPLFSNNISFQIHWPLLS